VAPLENKKLLYAFDVCDARVRGFVVALSAETAIVSFDFPSAET
jgi:hypothetical protein